MNYNKEDLRLRSCHLPQIGCPFLTVPRFQSIECSWTFSNRGRLSASALPVLGRLSGPCCLNVQKFSQFNNKPLFPFLKVGQVLTLWRISSQHCTWGAGAYHPNYHIQFFVKQPPNLIGGYRGQEFRSTSIPSYLRCAFNLLPHIPPFQQLSKKGEDHSHESISKSMLEHSFFNIILKLSLNYHCARLISFVGPSLDAQLSTHPVIPSYTMAFDKKNQHYALKWASLIPRLVVFLNAYVAKL